MQLYFATSFNFLPYFKQKIIVCLIILCSGCSCSKTNSLYEVIPAHRTCIPKHDFPRWVSWALFGNDDDGIYGEGPHARFLPHHPNNFCKFIRWWLRNPLHNFTFYVIGTADRVNSQFTLLRVSDTGAALLCKEPHKLNEFPFHYGGLFLALHGGKPYLSMRIPWGFTHCANFYFGWRCRGNFGIKFQPWHAIPPPKCKKKTLIESSPYLEEKIDGTS